MGERYRTLLGHFRHELGHYFFDQLIRHEPATRAACAQYFGDDKKDYQQALNKSHQNGAPADWP